MQKNKYQEKIYAHLFLYNKESGDESVTLNHVSIACIHNEDTTKQNNKDQEDYGQEEEKDEGRVEDEQAEREER